MSRAVRAEKRATDIPDRKLFGECLVLAAAKQRAQALLETIIAPAWQRAGGVAPPLIFDTLLGDGLHPLQRLAEARAVFVDISQGDASVIYHLGVRDALARLVTIPVHSGQLPGGLPSSLAARAVCLDDPAAAIAAIDGRLRDLWHKDDEFQSPVASAIPGLRVATRAPEPILGPPSQHLWSIAMLDDEGEPTPVKLSTRIGILCGDLRGAEGVDVWVNSENTYMEMGRMCDAGISALIRRMGANASDDTDFVDDIIQRELMRAVGGRRRPVPPASVFWTRPGRLAKKGVRRIAHVASVEPREPEGSGYVPVAELSLCVTNLLDALDRESTRMKRWSVPLRSARRAELRSILIPLMGTGNARDDARIVSCALISAAVDHLRLRPRAGLEKVLFLAYSDVDREMCRAALDSLPGLVREPH